MGNTAIGRLLATGSRIGRPHDAAEGAADRHAAAAGAGRKASGPPMRLDGAPRLGGGRTLPGQLMRRFAPHFRSDLRGVRLHTGREVDHAAHAMQAEAFTYGRDVFVRSDKYAPDTRSGRALLRHELAHVDADRGRGRVIRRKLGLPTASQAKTAGGGSGFGSWGKGEWGTYRGLLDDFRAARLDDTAKQIEVLRALTVSSAKMLASGYNAAKKTYVRQQMPKIKKLFYEVALKGDVFDTVESEARATDTDHRQSVASGIQSRMGRLRGAKRLANWKALAPEVKKTTRLSSVPVDMPTAPSTETLLNRLSQAKLTMNFGPSTLKYWIDDPDIKQFWQLESDKKVDGTRVGPKYAKSRDKAEVMMGYGSMFGTSGTVDEALRAHRPISCGLNVFNNPKGAAEGYGRWHFELKDAVKQRATYLSGDSIDETYNKVTYLGDARSDHMGTSDYLAGVLANNGYVFDALFMEETGSTDLGARMAGTRSISGDMSSVREAIDFDKYIEVQVHGGISVDDIDTLVVDVPQAKSRRTGSQVAEGALADAWQSKYRSKTRIRWS